MPVGGAPGVIAQGGAALLQPRTDVKGPDPLPQQGAEAAVVAAVAVVVVGVVVVLVVRGVWGEGSSACVGRWNGT